MISTNIILLDGVHEIKKPRTESKVVDDVDFVEVELHGAGVLAAVVLVVPQIIKEDSQGYYEIGSSLNRAEDEHLAHNLGGRFGKALPYAGISGGRRVNGRRSGT